MNKYLIMLAIALTGTVAKAESFALKVNLSGGTSATYVLDTKPVITYAGTNVTIKNQSLEDTYPLNNVHSFTFVENSSSGIETTADNVTYVFYENIFTCEGQEIRVFNLSGHSVLAGHDSVSLQALDNGIYIVNTCGRSIKVIKK